jgi:DNA-binding beta-propeller fold protein YncE
MISGGGRRTRAAMIAVLAGAIGTAAIPDGAAASTGFGPLSGQSGCLIAPGVTEESSRGCSVAKGLVGPSAVAVAPDGANVYVAGGKSGANVASSFGDLVVLRRDPTTGAVTESGCLSSDGTDGRDGASGACTPTPALLGADGVAVSPDGLTVFVTSRSSASVVAFARDPLTGSLTRLGCLQGTPRLGSPCRAANLYSSSAAIVASADNRALYVAAPGEGAISTLVSPATVAAGGPSPAASTPTVASIFTTPPTPTFLANPCIAINGMDGPCAVGTAMQGARALVLSPDAKQLYAAAPDSAAIDVFAPNAEGALSQTGCVKADALPGLCATSVTITRPSEIAVSPDGRNVYAGDSGPEGGRIDVLARNESTGALTDASCVDFLSPPRKPEPEEPGEEKEKEPEKAPEPALPPDRCERVPALNGGSVLAVSADGSSVYAFGSEAAVMFSRDPATGKLSETSCAASGDSRCTTLPSLEVQAAAVSPDGREVYVTSFDKVEVFGMGAAVVSARAAATRAGMAQLRVACPSALRRRCSGRVELTRTVAGARHGRRVGRPRRIAVGYSSRFSIGPGHEAVVRVRVSGTAARRLVAHRHVRLMATVRADALAGGSGYGRHVLFRLLHR